MEGACDFSFFKICLKASCSVSSTFPSLWQLLGPFTATTLALDAQHDLIVRPSICNIRKEEWLLNATSRAARRPASSTPSGFLADIQDPRQPHLFPDFSVGASFSEGLYRLISSGPPRQESHTLLVLRCVVAMRERDTMV